MVRIEQRRGARTVSTSGRLATDPRALLAEMEVMRMLRPDLNKLMADLATPELREAARRVLLAEITRFEDVKINYAEDYNEVYAEKLRNCLVEIEEPQRQ